MCLVFASLCSLLCFNSYSYESIIKILSPSLWLQRKSSRETTLVIFTFSLFFLFLVVLMFVTTVATSLYLYFSIFVPSLASDCKKGQKLVHAIQKQILSA